MSPRARSSRLVLKPFVVGWLATNCYLLADREAGEAAVVDPGTSSPSELEPILREAGRLGVELRLIINTHGHPDHVAGNPYLKERTGARVLIHELDADMLIRPPWPWPGQKPMRPDGLLAEGDVVRVGELALRVLHTPGHTRGSICLYCPEEAVLFSGDTLFAGSIGRTDLPESSPEDMTRSLARLAQLPDETAIYPGHGLMTTMRAEKVKNPFLRALL